MFGQRGRGGGPCGQKTGTESSRNVQKIKKLAKETSRKILESLGKHA